MLYGIAEGAAKAFEVDLHDVIVFESETFAEAERVRTEIVDVHITGSPMAFELEVVVLHVGQ